MANKSLLCNLKKIVFKYEFNHVVPFPHDLDRVAHRQQAVMLSIYNHGISIRERGWGKSEDSLCFQTSHGLRISLLRPIFLTPRLPSSSITRRALKRVQESHKSSTSVRGVAPVLHHFWQCMLAHHWAVPLVCHSSMICGTNSSLRQPCIHLS